MLSLKNIAIIARYETKVLWRNWFFRIFAIAIISILIFFNIGAFSPVSNSRWFHRAISSGIPYANMIFLNIVQVAVLVFLATGIIKHSKKLDTNEVFYVRSISNTDLVLGKAFALFQLFFWVNLAVLTVALIVNASTPDSDINLKAYVYYPLLISFPSILFTTGLSFLLVSIIRNQAISIILLLGMIGVILIYFQGKYYFLPDYIAFKLPLHASDIVGFSKPGQLLLHRGIYLCLAVAFLFATVFFLKRLPQRKWNRWAAALFTIVFLTSATGLTTLYLNQFVAAENLRQQMITLNGKMADVPNSDIKSCYLNLEHQGNEIHCRALLSVQNNHSAPLHDQYLTLNPTLKVTRLIFEGGEVDFTRNAQFILFKSTSPMLPGDVRSIEVFYQGSPDENVCYLEIQGERYDRPRHAFFYSIDKRFAFLQPDYALLTDELLWYPSARAGYNRESPAAGQNNFIDFRLKVKTRQDLTPVSQGRVVNTAPGIYEFYPEFALPQISLVIGDYKKKSITVDSVDFSLYFHSGNDYFSPYFDQVSDTLATLITDLKNAYEQEHEIAYVFPRLRLVETPLHFYAFTTLYQNHQAYVQPGTVMLPEKGGELWELDLKRQFRVMDRQAKQENRIMEDKDKQADIFKNFVKAVLTKQHNNSTFFWGNSNNVDRANYSLFPNLYWYRTRVESKRWPLLNKNLADYMNQELRPDNDMSRNWRGISFTEACNNLMREKTLEEILAEEPDFNKVARVISLKGDYLFKYLEKQIGKEAFQTFLRQMINRYTGSTLSYTQLRAAIKQEFQLDIEPVIAGVYRQKDQAAFVVSNLRHYQIRDGNRNRYQVRFMVENVEDVDGIIKVYFNDSRQNSRNATRAMNEQFHIFLIPKSQKKEIRFLLDERPGRIVINTLISKNVPSVINLSMRQFEMNERAKPVAGEITIPEENGPGPVEIIVDNEDDGFSTFSPVQEPYLKKLIQSNNNGQGSQKYYGEWRSSASRWRLTTGSDYFGKYVRSAHFTRSGNGEKLAIWQPDLQESAFYDVYVHLTGDNGTNAYYFNGKKRENINYKYQVFHDDGEDGITIDITRADRGWNFIGSFYFSEDTGKVTLSDKSENRSVFADAVKWVKQ